MRQVWMFAAAAALASLASPARAGDPPAPPPRPAEAAPAAQVTYYLELGDLGREQSEGLVALLKREFPTAQVELLEGTLRVQADGATFEQVGKLLEAQRRHDLAAGKKADRKADERGEKKERAAQPAPEKAAAAKKLTVKVGDLCGGCAECLAEGLAAKFPGLKFAPEETVVTVVGGGPEDRAAVEAWVTDARARLRPAHVAPGEHHERGAMEWEEALVVRDDGTVPRMVDADGTILIEGPDGQEARIVLKGVRPANPRAVKPPPPPPSIEELEKRLARAREARDEAAIDQAERALAQAREHAARLRERLQQEARPDGREGMDDLKQRFDALRQRLEREHGAAAPKPEGGRRPEPRARAEAAGPMAEWRQRLAHLKQAAEHLTAAGYEGLAKQVAEALKGAAAQAEEVARKLRAAEEAREAEQKRRAEAEREAAAARQRKAREGGDGAERRPAEGHGVEELTELVRNLKRQVEELRKQVQDLRERAAK